MDDIKKYFDLDNFKPLTEKSIYFLYQQDKDQLKKMPFENFEDGGNVNFLRSVYELILTLDKYDEDLQKVKKNITNMLEQDKQERRRVNNTTSHLMHNDLNQTYDKGSSILAQT
jgi:predicted nucleic acid-binding protein